MRIGFRAYTPRFCTVTVDEVFSSKDEARAAGYTEPTYYAKDGYEIYGKSLDMYHMVFAAFPSDEK